MRWPLSTPCSTGLYCVCVGAGGERGGGEGGVERQRGGRVYVCVCKCWYVCVKCLLKSFVWFPDFETFWCFSL